ncbi:hypothetical protein BCEP4_410050 [Burkholderia cepacia]|nr:hypothetical protein BCEP4_410050 [Burkholderia cepacia]
MHHQRIAIAQVIQRGLKLGAFGVLPARLVREYLVQVHAFKLALRALVYRADADVTDVLALVHDSSPWSMCQVGVYDPVANVSIIFTNHPILTHRACSPDSQVEVYSNMTYGAVAYPSCTMGARPTDTG